MLQQTDDYRGGHFTSLVRVTRTRNWFLGMELIKLLNCRFFRYVNDYYNTDSLSVEEKEKLQQAYTLLKEVYDSRKQNAEEFGIFTKERRKQLKESK